MVYVYPGTKVDLGGGRGWLDGPAAASIFRLDAILGHRMQITEAGRSFFTQEQHWLKYLRDGYPIALNPNTPSEHQKGKAVDSNEAQQFVATMEEHGWFRTVYRWVNGKWTLVERWHFEYFYDRDQHRNDPPAGGGTTTTTTEEDGPMRVFHCKDQGGRVSLWTLINEGTGELIQTRDGGNATTWIRLYPYKDLSGQPDGGVNDFLTALDATKKTTTAFAEMQKDLDELIAHLATQV